MAEPLGIAESTPFNVGPTPPNQPNQAPQAPLNPGDSVPVQLGIASSTPFPQTFAQKYPKTSFVLRQIPDALPAIAGAVGAAVPGAGLTGLPELGLAGLGSVAGVELRNEFPSVFGEPPKTPLELGLGLGTDVALQGIMPESAADFAYSPKRALADKLANSSILNDFPAVKKVMAKYLTDLGMKRYTYHESGILESAGENAQNTSVDLVKKIASGDAAAIAKHDAIFGENEIGDRLIKLQNQFDAGPSIAGNESYEKAANTVLSSLQQVKNWKLATGEAITIKQLALNDLVTNGFKASEGVIDAGKILDRLGGAKREIYEEAIGPKALSSFKDFLGTLQKQETTGVVGNLVNWSGNHLMWSLGAPLISGGLLGHEGIGLATTGIAGGMMITNKMLGKIASKPAMLKLITQAMKTPATSPQAPLIQKALEYGFRSTFFAGTRALSDNPAPPPGPAAPQQ